MAMDPETGKIRALDSTDELKENEVLFSVGERVELKACQFEVTAIQADPTNEVTLKGIPKKEVEGEEGQSPKEDALPSSPPGA